MFYRKCLVLDGGGIAFNNFSDKEASQSDLDAEFADADKTRRQLERELADDSGLPNEPVNMGNDDEDFDDFDNEGDKADESDDFSEFDNDEDFDDGREAAYLKSKGLYRKQIRSIDDLAKSYTHLEKRLHSEARKNKRRQPDTNSRPAPESAGFNTNEEIQKLMELAKVNPLAATAQVVNTMMGPLIAKQARMERNNLASNNEFSPEMREILDELADDYPDLDPEAQMFMAKGKISEEMSDRDRERHERRGEKRENQRRGAYRETAGTLRVRTASDNTGRVLAKMKAAGADHRKMRRYLEQRKLAD